MSEDANARGGVETYSVREAAAILGIGKDAAYEAARTGRIPALWLGTRRVRIPRAPLHRMIDSVLPVGAQ